MELTKNKDGWSAMTRIDLPNVVAYGAKDKLRAGGRAEGKSVLMIQTSKAYYGGLRTHARVSWVGEHFETHAIGAGTGTGDFSSVVLKTDARCTEKNVRDQHTRCLASQDQIVAAAVAFYAARGDVVPA